MGKYKKLYEAPNLVATSLEIEDSVASGSAVQFHTEGAAGEASFSNWKIDEKSQDEWF